MTALSVASATSSAFEHVALLYANDDEYLAGTVPFIRQGVEQGEAVMVAVPERRVRLLREALADVWHGDLVTFRPMELIGRNPAWIIPAWMDFTTANMAVGRRVRGVSQPIWAERCPEELVECARQVALLNVVFADRQGFTLLCPYSTTTLPDTVIVEAMRNHPLVTHGAGPPRTSYRYRSHVPSMLTDPLPLAGPGAERLRVADGVAVARAAAAAVGDRAGLGRRRADDFLLAVSEVVTNSIVHTDGMGDVTLWHNGGVALCDVRDRGRIADRLVGSVRPDAGGDGGRGLWVVNQVCDLVQIRSTPVGQVVRVHVRNR